MTTRIVFFIFVWAFSLGVSSANNLVASKVTKGQECLSRPKTCALEKRLDDIVAITHYIYDQGKKSSKDRDYASGSFVVVDPGYEVLTALLAYVKSKKIRDLCREDVVSLKTAYPRKSTHFNNLYIYRGFAKKKFALGVAKTDCRFTHYGIDVPRGKLPMLHKRHILFGRVGTIDDRDLIFIKLEEYGLGIKDVSGHTLELFKSIVRKRAPTGATTSEELYKNRRESVPSDIRSGFSELIRNIKDQIGEDNFNSINDRVKAFGIQAMTKTIDMLTANKALDPKDLQDLQSFKADLVARYPSDYFMRFGNEIIIR